MDVQGAAKSLSLETPAPAPAGFQWFEGMLHPNQVCALQSNDETAWYALLEDGHVLGTGGQQYEVGTVVPVLVAMALRDEAIRILLQILGGIDFYDGQLNCGS